VSAIWYETEYATTGVAWRDRLSAEEDVSAADRGGSTSQIAIPGDIQPHLGEGDLIRFGSRVIRVTKIVGGTAILAAAVAKTAEDHKVEKVKKKKRRVPRFVCSVQSDILSPIRGLDCPPRLLSLSFNSDLAWTAFEGKVTVRSAKLPGGEYVSVGRDRPTAEQIAKRTDHGSKASFVMSFFQKKDLLGSFLGGGFDVVVTGRAFFEDDYPGLDEPVAGGWYHAEGAFDGSSRLCVPSAADAIPELAEGWEYSMCFGCHFH
jgi:hypothetical protein